MPFATRLAALAAPLALLAIQTAPAAAGTVDVANAPQFQSAVERAAPGDVIRLAAGRYPLLTVYEHRYAGAPLHIVGGPDTVIAGLKLRAAANITIEGLRVSPGSGDSGAATLNIASSSGVLVHGLAFDGIDEAHGARLDVESDSSDVTIESSDFANCGHGMYCVQPGGTRVTVRDSTFHDCVDCDFVDGGGDDVVLQGNSFDLATVGVCGPSACHHNDFIQVMAGGPWTIVDNRFGRHDHGAAAVFLKPGNDNRSRPIHDVAIESNLFWATAESPFLYAIRVGDDPGRVGMPVGVSIVNNTILSGVVSGIRLGAPYARMPLAQRPLVANNLIARFPPRNCALGRFDHNVMVAGATCDATDALGPAPLSARYAPTPASALLVDRADAAQAPLTDLFGHPRVGAPDVGAIELVGRDGAASAAAVYLRLSGRDGASARIGPGRRS